MNISMRNVLLVLRRKQNLSQKQVSDLLFVSRSTYNKWENDIGEIPHSKLFLIAKIYHISIHNLIMLLVKENSFTPSSGVVEGLVDESIISINEKLNSIIKILDEKHPR